MDALSTLGPFPPSLPNFPVGAQGLPGRKLLIAEPPMYGWVRRSSFQVELAAQPIGNGFDHVATIRVPLRPVPHDLDFPGVFVRHDRDREIRRPVADVFHLQPDGGLQFFAGFGRLLQADSFSRAERDHRLWLSARAHVFEQRAFEPLAIRYRRRTQTAGDGPTSQRRRRGNVPTACYFAGGLNGLSA